MKTRQVGTDEAKASMRRVWRQKAWLALCVSMLWSVAGCLPGEPRTQQRVVAGAYDAETRYDMQTLSGALTQQVQPWRAPDQMLRERIIGQFQQKYGARTAGLVEQAYGATIEQDIRSHLNAYSPPWLLGLTSKLDVVDGQLKRFDVKSSILLSDSGSGQLEATQIWDGISVFRDPSCRDAGNLSCDQIDISIQDLLDAEYPIEIASSNFVGSASGDTLTMRDQVVRLNYGRLALYLITNLALPDKPGAGLQLRDVVLAAFNCRGVAGRLTGEDGVLGWTIAGVQVGISLNDIIGTCEDGIFAMTNDFVDQFNVPLNMNLNAAISLIDRDFDGTIDELATSTITGSLNASFLNGQSSHEGPVSGQMTGWRVGDVSSDEWGDDTSGGMDIDDGTVIWGD